MPKWKILLFLFDPLWTNLFLSQTVLYNLLGHNLFAIHIKLQCLSLLVISILI
jgi:hypothetical protein